MTVTALAARVTTACLYKFKFGGSGAGSGFCPDFASWTLLLFSALPRVPSSTKSAAERLMALEKQPVSPPVNQLVLPLPPSPLYRASGIGRALWRTHLRAEGLAFSMASAAHGAGPLSSLAGPGKLITG